MCHACVAGTLPTKPLLQPRECCQAKAFLVKGSEMNDLPECLIPTGITLLDNREACCSGGLAPDLCCHILRWQQDWVLTWISYDCTSAVCIGTTGLVVRLCQVGQLSVRVGGRQPANLMSTDNKE